MHRPMVHISAVYQRPNYNDVVAACYTRDQAPISERPTITLPVGVAGFVSQFDVLWGQMSAVSTIAIIPILVFTLAVQRYLVRGLTFGAVK